MKEVLVIDNTNHKLTLSSNVLIVIVNFNGAIDTTQCINSLKKISYKNFDIIIVDNASNEKDKKLLGSLLNDNIEISYSAKNHGYSGGNNIGIKKAIESNYQYVLLLNNDTVVEKDFLTNLITSIKFKNDIGICAPKINYFSDRNLIWSYGGKINKLRGSGFSDFENKVDNINITNRYVDFASGCCLLIKREVFEKVGLLDENYFLYLEDTDFCMRVTNNGFKILVVSDSKIYHKVNATTSKANLSLPIYYTTRNRLYFSKKLFSNWHYVVKSYLFFTMHIKFIFWFVSKKRTNVYVVKKAFRDFKNKKMGKSEDL